MKLIVAGNRYLTDRELVARAIEASGVHVTGVLCTCSLGPARVAGHWWARMQGVPADHFPINWRLDGSKAARIVYLMLFQLFGADLGVIAIWDGRSASTATLLSLARRWRLPVYEHRVGGAAEARPLAQGGE